MVLSTSEMEDRDVDAQFDGIHKLLMDYNEEHPEFSLSLEG